MIQVLLGSVALSLIHALIPNHWIPLVAVSRSEGWNRSEALTITAVAGFAHSASTILLGVLVGFTGFALADRHSFLVSIAAPAVLVGLGFFYLLRDLLVTHHHHFHLDPEEIEGGEPGSRTKTSIVFSLCAAMFFSPCLEIEAYYFSAGTRGWAGIATVSVVYLVMTVAGMLVLVDLGRQGAERIRSRFLEHHEQRVTGAVLVVLGIVAYLLGP